MNGRFPRFGLVPVAALLACVTVGCARRPDPVLAPVAGSVTRDGKPLANVLVRFAPAARGIPAEWISEGTTDAAGRYALECAKGAGAVVGKHLVTVSEGSVPDDIRDDQGKVAAWLGKLSGRPLPERYATAATSPLEADVAEGGGDHDFDLAR